MKFWYMLQHECNLKTYRGKWARNKRTYNIVWLHLYEILRIGKFIKTESRVEVTRGWGGGTSGNYCLMSTELLFGVMKIVEIDSGGNCTTLQMYLMPLQCKLTNGYNGTFYIKCDLPPWEKIKDDWQPWAHWSLLTVRSSGQANSWGNLYFRTLDWDSPVKPLSRSCLKPTNLAAGILGENEGKQLRLRWEGVGIQCKSWLNVKI